MPTIIDLAVLQPTEGFTMRNGAVIARAGWSVSAAGDINGDGFDDFIVGAPYGSIAGANAGQAYVIFGRAGATRADIVLDTLNATAIDPDGFIIRGDTGGDQAGFSVSSAGDVNGDGIDDLIVGAPDGDDGGASAGEAYVIFGRAGATRTNVDLTGHTASSGFIIRGDTGGDQAGRSVSSAGDINGDGIDDLIVGAPFGDDGGDQAGEAYVIFGKTGATRTNIDLTTLSTSDGFIIRGDATYDRAGTSVSSAGDVNGDGIDDLIVGAPSSGAGKAYVIFGKAGATRTNIDLTTLSASDGFFIAGKLANDSAGYSVSSAGDVNGDGIDDLLIGAPSADNGGIASGEAYVIFGKAGATRANINLSILTASDGFVIQGHDTSNYAGRSVSAAGDIDGDGLDDLIVGASGSSYGASNAGAAYVIFGKVGAARRNIDLTDLDERDGFIVLGFTANNRAGFSVSGAGDINGDGFDDLLMGAPYSSFGGRTYLIWGSAALTSPSGALNGTPTNNILNGTSSADVISGFGGNDSLYAGAGNDVLNGGTGADFMDGGLGDDIYFVDNASDSLVDAGGFDTVNSSISFTLATGFENLTLNGSATLQGTGNAADNVITANAGVNQLFGLGGDDVFVLGASLTAADSIDGGSGVDQVGISGNYTGANALVLGATTLTNVEVLALLPGAGNSYTITSNDGTVAAGVEMTIFAGNLGAGQNFTFNGSAESNGFFSTFGGLGTDTITGSAGSDGFYFGPGKWQVGDSVVGGGGTNDQLALDGDYTVTIGFEASVEVLVLLAGPDGAPNSFNITLSDAWTPGGGRRTIFARNTTLGVTINGAAETNTSLTIFGGRGNDTLITGGGGIDTLHGLEGNDLIIGGNGSGDAAVYQGARVTYSVVTGGGNVQIVDNDAVADGNDGTDTVVGIELAQFRDQTISITSPIILDLDGGGVETLSAAQSNARFDMDGDGIGDDTSWFGRGEGLLFLDRDGNGTLSDAGEMSFTNDVANARSDLEGLAAWDSNGDGQLSSQDARFASFKIWRDRDGDGVVDRREIMTLKQAGVRSLSLTGTAHNGSYALGDTAIVNTGSFTRTNGRRGGLVDAVLTAVSSKDATARTGQQSGQQSGTAPAIDRGLFTGSFSDSVAQLDPSPSEQRSQPSLTASERDAGDIALATATPLTVIDDYGNWLKADSNPGLSLDATLDRRVLLMAQDMASFGATNTSAETDRWRREGVAVELFAA